MPSTTNLSGIIHVAAAPHIFVVKSLTTNAEPNLPACVADCITGILLAAAGM